MLKIFLVISIFFTSNILASEEYFLTLRNDEVNLRQGPSFDYPIKIFYKKKYLPVIVQDKSGNFRKIRDHENNTGWIHVSQLSKKKASITIIDDVLVFKNSTVFSKPIVVIEKGKLCLIIKCVNEWCKIKVNNYVGWIKSSSLWEKNLLLP
jgi:SH3-like domain-containing protein